MSKTINKFRVEKNNLAEEEPLRKKTKLEHEDISRKLHKQYPEIDIKEHKIQKLILIFQDLIALAKKELH